MKIDLQQYGIFQEIFDYFNFEFFRNQLPEIVFTLDYRQHKAFGYFHYQKLKHEEKPISIISMNPDCFNRENIDILATIAHEMCHALDCQTNIKAEFTKYHSKSWGSIMESIGLVPSSDGTPEGKKTGVNMHHYIYADGLFERKAKEFIEKHNNIFLFSGVLHVTEKKAADRNKVKYVCKCETKIWGKPGLRVRCNECDSDFKSYEINEEEGDL
jgi:predicted SprT family Zn-dependent metalloprotease